MFIHPSVMGNSKPSHETSHSVGGLCFAASPAAEVGHSRPAEDWTEPGDMESSEVLKHLGEALPVIWNSGPAKKAT